MKAIPSIIPHENASDAGLNIHKLSIYSSLSPSQESAASLSDDELPHVPRRSLQLQGKSVRIRAKTYSNRVIIHAGGFLMLLKSLVEAAGKFVQKQKYDPLSRHAQSAKHIGRVLIAVREVVTRLLVQGTKEIWEASAVLSDSLRMNGLQVIEMHLVDDAENTVHVLIVVECACMQKAKVEYATWRSCGIWSGRGGSWQWIVMRKGRPRIVKGKGSVYGR
ncbi:uncharacterized protein EDB91DRAFT_1334644 [Suillus paluster]|uniref:uncharacterized protein n=1 Tax=Suillus paluster TaxID=48578 RepID=UPI001B872ED3|nr:uncharacterized protein EDB91DRAFT_1334644 [Suillus paluster]KAG1748451.1 hypothetical protein EDB91DRAFT_1334644 [Suillus paluster]